MNPNLNWNDSARYEAVGWSFGLFGRLQPELIWLICKSNYPNSEHPDILQCLYVCRLSCYCNGESLPEGARMYLGMSDWAGVHDAEIALVVVPAGGVWGMNMQINQYMQDIQRNSVYVSDQIHGQRLGMPGTQPHLTRGVVD
jgi:hypothetical protein